MNNSRPFVMIGLLVGSTIGGLIPDLWGAGIFSFSGMFLSAVGAIAGIYIGFNMSKW